MRYVIPSAICRYPWGWAWAGNTPLRLWKRYTWLGGVRTPLVARKGRASYLGDRSAGHQDPGATSTYYLFKSAAETLAD